MKKQLLKSVLLICTALTMISANAFAGHNEGRHYSCPWYWNHRYWAEAHVGCFWNVTLNYNQSCYSAFAAASRSCLLGRVGKAQSWSNPWSMGGWVQNAGGTWGGQYADLSLEIGAPYFMPDDDDPPTSTNYTEIQQVALKPVMGDPDAPQISLDSITIHLVADPTSTLTNSYTLTVWTPQNDDDTVITDDKTIIAGTVKLLNGELTVTGNLFQASDFNMSTVTQSQGGQGITVDYVGGPKMVQLPAGITSSQVDINSQGDIKGDENGTYRTISGSAATQQIVGDENFTVYPNPANTRISLGFSMKEDRIIDLGVYDMNGKLVMEQKQVSVKAGSQVVLLDVSKLPAGEYYILAKNKDIKVLKQFIKL